MFIVRPSVYDREAEDPRRAELIIAKQRNGPTGTISLQFDGLSGHAKNLVSASHTELAKRLSAKGLTLDDLRV